MIGPCSLCGSGPFCMDYTVHRESGRGILSGLKGEFLELKINGVKLKIEWLKLKIKE
jgi:hypothetical protein